MSSRWLKFSKLFNFTPKKKPGVTLQYRAGYVGQVTEEAAAAAIAGGVAEEVQAPSDATTAAAMKAGEVDAKAVESKPADTGGKSGKAS